MYVIPKVAPKAIAKPSTRSNGNVSKKASKMDDHQRELVNQRERKRTSTMNKAFEDLKALLSTIKVESKTKTLELTNHYINFLFMMVNDDCFFNLYSCEPIQHAFKLYLIKEQIL